MDQQLDGIRLHRLSPESRILAVATPEAAGLDLAAWAGAHREALDAALDEHGALLFRGFDVPDQGAFFEVSGAASELLDYVYRSTVRSAVGDKIYTSTEYPARVSIPMHCENSYQHDWPTRLFFYCAQPPREGGRTPLADVAGVTDRIDPAIRETFREKGVMYVRNYSAGPGFDLPWPTVFQTQDRGEVEAYCREHGIQFEWRPNNALRTWQVCQGMAAHPRTGKLLWFNQAHLFHVSSLEPKTRDALLRICKSPENLPRNSWYGDGSPIETEVLDEVRRAFDVETVSFPWEKGDLLMVDNMAVAHGRTPYEGERKILVTMGDAYSARQRSQPAGPIVS
jgi:alpha-ketoglutarate-dependent taurine dioxygenase